MKIPLSNINLTELEKDYAKDALDTEWISGTGKYITRFEDTIAKKIERKHVVAVTNGTVALELALLALGIQADDEVIVPALTFAAPAAAVCSVGAIPIFADITLESWTIDPKKVAQLITNKTKAIIVVDLLGHPGDYEALLNLGVPIIEDAAQAHGSLYKGRPVGSFGAIATFSFHANKAITSGEGGCVATDDDRLMERMRLIANHGMTKERPYWHPVVGHNFRMTNVTAAIGLGQAERWDDLVAARNLVAQTYDEFLRTSVLIRRPVAPWASEACWLYTIATTNRESVLTILRAKGIDARAIWSALPDLPPYNNCRHAGYNVAKKIADTAFWLPTWSYMPNEAIYFVANTLKEYFF